MVRERISLCHSLMLSPSREPICRTFSIRRTEPDDCSLDELFSLLAVRLKRLVPHDAFALYLIKDDKLIPAICHGRQLPAVLVAYVFP